MTSATSTPLVLVVEDEPMLLQSVVTGLGRIAGIQVVGVGSVAAAIAEAQKQVPALVLSDIDLPDRSGLELLGEFGARGFKPHVVFISAYVKAYRAQIPQYAGVEVLEKPVSLEQLRELVNARVTHSYPSPSPFGVADFLQLASLGRHSVRLAVSGAVTGNIFVVGGEAWSAQDDRGSGMDAFRRLAQARPVMVQCQTLVGEPGARDLTGTAEALLLECARLADEESLGSPVARGFTELSLDEPTPPAPAAEPPAPPKPAEKSFDEVFETALAASLRKDYQAALAAFREAAVLKPGDAKVQINIARLEKLLEQRAS
ncbi:MAG: response regulator [Myxococcaceae bacterium]